MLYGVAPYECLKMPIDAPDKIIFACFSGVVNEFSSLSGAF